MGAQEKKGLRSRRGAWNEHRRTSKKGLHFSGKNATVSGQKDTVGKDDDPAFSWKAFLLA